MNYELFERALVEKKISRRKLAGMIGVNVNTFLSALGRKSDLDPDTVARIAKILEVDYTELSLSRESWETFRTIEEINERNKNDPGYLQSLMQSAPPEDVFYLFHSLNALGQEKVKEYIRDLANNPKYRRIEEDDNGQG